MKKIRIKVIAVVLIILNVQAACAQNVGINSTGTNPNSSALLDVESTDKGILIPRVSLSSTTDVTTIATPATNLLVFNTNTSMTNGNGTGFYYYNGSNWTYMVSPSNGPGTSGEVLTSQGGGNPPEWASTGGNCFPTEVTNELDASGNPCSGTSCGTTRTMRNCVIDCNNLTFNGNSDWRTPLAEELVTLIPIAPGNTSPNSIWTTTPGSSSSRGIITDLSTGSSNISALVSSSRWCRCVR